MHRTAILVLCNLATALASVKVLEKEALLKIYNYTVGDHWLNNKNWHRSNDPCDITTRWFGVGCYDPCDFFRDGPLCYAGRITSVNLRANNLTGPLPTEIGNLLNVTFVDLSHNSLTGTIPSEFGQINNIHVLNLAHNFFSGVIPAELGYMNNNGAAYLTELNLGFNSLIGPVPEDLKSLIELKYLDLSNNGLTGQIPNEFSNNLDDPSKELFGFPKLQVLYVQRNDFGGSIPTTIGYMTNLRYLHMYENAKSGGIQGPIPPSIGMLTKLNEFHAWNNTLSGSIPEDVGNMTNLRSLRINQNHLSGPLPQSIGNLSHLYYLDTYANQMTGDMPDSVANLISLQYLYVQNEHYLPLRKKYCKQRLPQVGKYSYRIVRDDYMNMMAMECPEPHSTEFTFNALPDPY